MFIFKVVQRKKTKFSERKDDRRLAPIDIKMFSREIMLTVTYQTKYSKKL